MKRLSTMGLTLALLTGIPGIALAAPNAITTHGAAGPEVHRARHVPMGDRDTAALNLLEAQGYGQIVQFRPDGQTFDATVTQNGKDLQLTVDPGTGQIQHRT